MAQLYKYFSRHWEHVLDFSDQSLIDLFNHESYGTPIQSNNGYAHGKKYLNLHVTMWKEDIRDGTLFLHELYEDPNLPNEWLDKVFQIKTSK